MTINPKQDRFESLDVLRGIAVLAIFAINIQAMALPAALFANPSLNTEHFDAEGQQIWAVASTFIQFKFITIFSALFGAGIMLMVGEDKPSPRFSLHIRRMIWLLLFGLVHAFVIWFGDILTPYAIAGLIVVLARRRSPVFLYLIGILLIAVAYLFQMSMHLAPPDARAEMITGFWAPPPEVIAEEIATYQKAFLSRIEHTAPTAIMFQLIQTIMLAPRNIGVMMIGMALYKSGFFTLGWSFIRYLIFGIPALLIGLAASHFATTQFFANDFQMFDLFQAQSAQYWGSLPHAFGYAALVMAICKIPGISLIRHPFATAGQMALTNYLMCSIIGAFIYYGAPGLGQIGTQSYPQIAMTVVGVWIAILIWSPLWLSLFRFGPFEWLWRSLTYWRFQPMRR